MTDEMCELFLQKIELYVKRKLMIMNNTYCQQRECNFRTHDSIIKYCNM